MGIVTNVKFNHPHENQGVNVSNDLSEEIIRHYFYTLYTKFKADNQRNNYFSSDWKKDNSEIIECYLNLGMIIKIGSVIIQRMKDCDLITTK